MSFNRVGGVLVGLMVAGGAQGVAVAQVADLGSRAQGMAGAFVAVADDASAVYWNPAGLGGAVVVSALFEAGRQRAAPDGVPVDAPAGTTAVRQDGRLFAVALPQIGLSYYRMRYAGVLLGTAGTGPDGRQVQDRDVSFRAVETRQAGVTLTQSLADGVVVGTTVRYVRAGASGADARRSGGWGDLTDEASDLEVSGDGQVDLDAGLMAGVGRLRVGLVVRNLRQPSFEVAGAAGSVKLARHGRVGLAYGTGWPGNSRLVVAVDADVTRVTSIGSERRDVAVGAEAWAFARRLGVRAGARASTLGDARPVGSMGLSLGVTSALFVDAHVSRGSDKGERSWSVGGRVVY